MLNLSQTIMKRLALLLIVYVSITNVNSQEVCEKHNNLNYTIEAQNCKLYCCGSCNRRYCCNIRAIRLNQELCDPEDCLAYYDNLQVHFQPEYCSGRFCCGSCNDRYCCSNPKWRFNQSSCPNREPTETTNSGYFLPDTSRKLNRGISKFYWWVGTIYLFLLCYYIWRNWDDRRRHRQELTNNAINNLVFYRNTTPTLNSQQNNTNISSDAQHLISNVQPSSSTGNNETDNICNTNVYDDLPPSYASLIIKDETTEETVEANANNP